MDTRSQKSAHRYKRSPTIVWHWSERELVCFECTSGRRLAVVPEVVSLLHTLGAWHTAAEAHARHPEFGARADMTRLLKDLTLAGLVQRRDRAWLWQPWMPEAAFFHFGTRGGTYPLDPREQDETLTARARVKSPPLPTKRIRGRTIDLPDPAVQADLLETLRARRTWRNFGRKPLTLSAISTLLHTTWGVQKWGSVPGQGSVVLKTSPSAGARHPIEAYLFALRVEGLPAGVFHYDAGRHQLVDLRRTTSRHDVEGLLANQFYFRGAGAIVVMTAMFERSMWKYPTARAYRTVLIDAGHLGQTFCLTATALGLAPFCTMAFHDRAVDRVIGIDSVSEGAVYVVGVGPRPTVLRVRPGQISGDRRP